MIIDYFESPDKKHWIEEIRKADWNAAKFLANLLEGTEPTYGSFENALGKGTLYLLTLGGELISFLTLTQKDCIDDDTLKPWIGFVYTFPRHRGNRRAGMLIDYAVNKAERAGCEKVYIATDHTGLYEKYGFVYLEKRLDIYGEESNVLYRRTDLEYSFTAREMPVEYAGNKIYGKAYIPDRTGKLCAVILSHGYNSSHKALADIAKGLARRGIFAYCYDFCGGSTRSESSGSPLDMTIRTEQADLRAVTDMVASLDYINKDVIYLYGESQGGFVSVLNACEAPEKINGLMLLYPALCIPDDWKSRAENCLETIDFMGMTISKKFCEDLPEFNDVLSDMAQFKRYVHIFHGDADETVRIMYSQLAKETFPHAELTVFPGEGHGFSLESRKKVLTEMIRFIIANNALRGAAL